MCLCRRRWRCIDRGKYCHMFVCEAKHVETKKIAQNRLLIAPPHRLDFSYSQQSTHIMYLPIAYTCNLYNIFYALEWIYKFYIVTKS